MSWTVERATVAGLKRRRPSDDPAVAAAVARLKTARLEDHVRRLVDQAPPLTPEQASKLAVLLLSPRDALPVEAA